MAIFEVHSTLSHRSLMNRSRRDLEDRLALVARHKGLTRDHIASAIMFLADRIPPENPHDAS
jgi:hypothetical protein